MTITRFIAACALAAASCLAQAQSGPADQNHPPPLGGKDHAPPREAVAACASFAAGASCSFAGHQGQTVSGLCQARQSAEVLSCRPNALPPHGDHPHGAPAGHPGGK